ncbi:MAG: hypothetical protein LBP60_07025 [Spirochaetaceae bacterium]|jgi:hypothetical protein|nr:hypothetical protein [Spirochaetaceae bacterium]
MNKTPRIEPKLQKKKKPSKKAETKGIPARPDMPVLHFVVFIIDWLKAKNMTEILEESHVRFHFICKGQGTASSEILDLLGLGSIEKAVVICLEQNIMVPVLLKRVSKSLGLHNPGAGIAFTVPLSGINKPILRVFKESIHKNISDEERKENKTMKDPKEPKKLDQKEHDLIVIVVNQGYADELMACARDAGASGGTVIGARGLVHQGPVKFFGILVQDEKEIITILTNRNKRVPIMQAISQSFGMASKAQGIVFSLPAENITGLDLD